MEELLTQAFWIGLLKIIGVNIILSGDNAVVIALAARSLPPKQRKQAIFWGAGAAVVLRILLTIFAVALLTLPWLKIIGSLLLFWIGIKLLVPEEGGDDEFNGLGRLPLRMRRRRRERHAYRGRDASCRTNETNGSSAHGPLLVLGF